MGWGSRKSSKVIRGGSLQCRSIQRGNRLNFTLFSPKTSTPPLPPPQATNNDRSLSIRLLRSLEDQRYQSFRCYPPSPAAQYTAPATLRDLFRHKLCCHGLCSWRTETSTRFYRFIAFIVHCKDAIGNRLLYIMLAFFRTFQWGINSSHLLLQWLR